MRPLALLALCVASFAIGAPWSAGATTLGFTGTLELAVPYTSSPDWPRLRIAGAGSAQVTDDGSFHLLSLLLPAGAFGPITTSLPVTGCCVSTNSVVFTGVGNLAGSFTGISGGPPGGGTMGVSGIAKVCLIFASCSFAYVPFPLAPTAGGAGFGIGGTATFPGNVAITMVNAPWTIGQPTMTIHSPNSTISIPVLPGGFAHGPASLASSTARPSGALQLVTVSKVFTNLTGAFPELPVVGILTLHFVPEPGTLLLLGSGVAALGALARRRRRR
jgi:hypothetical protein